MKRILLTLALCALIGAARAELRDVPEAYSEWDDADFIQLSLPGIISNGGLGALNDKIDWPKCHGFIKAKVNGKSYLVAKEPRTERGHVMGFVCDYGKNTLYVLYEDQYMQFVSGDDSVLSGAGIPIK
jgi:hypothetical protein